MFRLAIPLFHFIKHKIQICVYENRLLYFKLRYLYIKKERISVIDITFFNSKPFFFEILHF